MMLLTFLLWNPLFLEAAHPLFLCSRIKFVGNFLAKLDG